MSEERKSFREVAFQLIDEERERQIEKGKIDNHPWILWLTIMTDYLGRIAYILYSMAYKPDSVSIDTLLKEVVKLEAIGVAFIEHIILESDSAEPEVEQTAPHHEVVEEALVRESVHGGPYEHGEEPEAEESNENES
jgi:hypothetical protein